MELEFIPLDYDYFDWQGRNYVKIIGRDDRGKRACIIDSFQPYLWAILKPCTEKRIQEIRNEIETIKIESPSRITSVLKTELHNKNFLGKQVKAIKIFITNYKDAHAVADEISQKEIEARREYDLSLTTKYIIDKKIRPLCWYKIEGELLNNSPKFGNIDASLDVDTCLEVETVVPLTKQPFSPKILAYDIEVGEFEIGKGEILMISLVGENFKKVLTWKKCPTNLSYVECFKDEEEMIEVFIKHVKEQDPDLLVGYFSDGFDMPYLRARAEKNKIKLSLGLDNKQPSFARGRIPSAKIPGIIHVDLFRFISSVYSQYLQSETLSLDDVASELLGEKKHDFNPYEHIKLKKPDWKEFFKYNLQDSVLTFKLAGKFWPDMIEFSKIIQEPLFDITRNSMSQLVENYILHHLEQYNEITEKRPLHDDIGERRKRGRYEGAFVLQPQASLYENLAIFDFTSMYGSIIVTHNLSKSTHLENKEKNSTEVLLDKEKTYFSKKPGFFPEMLKEIIEKRKKYKQEFKQSPTPITKARSNAYKLLTNAAYGYQGFFGARYYCIEAAAATAALARKHIKEVIDKINKQGYSVIYSDTDSIAFLLNKKTKTQTKEFLKTLNKELPGVMELDLEDFYKRGIWVTKRSGDFGAKKKYALISEDKKIKIRGFETVRRDWCPLSREVQNRIIKMVLENGNEKKALEYLKTIIKKIKKREIDKKELIIRTQLKKPLSEYKAISPHVIAARKMKENEIPISEGNLVEYYIAEIPDKKSKLVREKVKLPNEPGEYNIEYYLERQIIPAIENIFQIFGINVEELINKKNQGCLNKWM